MGELIKEVILPTLAITLMSLIVFSVSVAFIFGATRVVTL